MPMRAGSLLLQSLAVALVVGTVLNLIGQAPVLPNEWRIVANYIVPFVVATVSQLWAMRSSRA